MKTEKLEELTFGKWPVLVFAILAFGVSIGLPVALSVMFLDWQETFQVSRAETAAVHSTCVGFLFGAGIIPGYMMNRFGARITILIGSVLASIGFILSMFAVTIDHLIMTTGVLGGLGCCFIQIPCIPCLTVIFDKYRSLIISMCTICSALVNIVVPYVYRVLADQFSWRGVLGIYACIILNIAVFGMIFTSVKPKKPELSSCLIEISDHALTEEPDMSLDEGIVKIDRNDSTDHMDQEPNIADGSHSYENGDTLEQNNTVLETLKQKSYGLGSDNDKHTNFLKRIKMSKCYFILDPMFCLFIAHSVFCLACIFTFPLLLMDFSKTRGFDKSTGVEYFTTVFIASIIGRVFVGILNLHPRFHSITLYTMFSIGGMIIFFFLTFIKGYTLTMICLSLYGLCYGSVIALQLKCIVDIKAINLKSYPLALGFCMTLEGMADSLVPVMIAYSVDSTGTYTFILIFMGCVGMVFCILLGAGFRFIGRKEHTKLEDNHKPTNESKDTEI